jgi:N-acetyl-anhydromuramyl-L-alanine amidase AmpD
MTNAPDIIPCLLDIDNTCDIEGATVSSFLQSRGRKHLWDNRVSSTIDTIVIHYISALDVDKLRPFDLSLILKVFCDKAVSSHYLIQRDGKVFRLVPEDKKAWHCGGSIMPAPDGRANVNEFSIGIELVATHESGFTKEQYVSCAGLIANIEKRIGSKCVRVGHEDIAGNDAVLRGLRKDVKRDPGPLFDWQLLAKQTS